MFGWYRSSAPFCRCWVLPANILHASLLVFQTSKSFLSNSVSRTGYDFLGKEAHHMFMRSSVLTNSKFIIPTASTMSAKLKIRHIRKCMNGVTIPSHLLAVF
jgi:hypothetical protein